MKYNTADLTQEAHKMSDQHLGNVPCSHLVFIVFPSFGTPDQFFSFFSFAIEIQL